MGSQAAINTLPPAIRPKAPSYWGLVVGVVIVGAWLASTAYWLTHPIPPVWAVPLVFLLQTHLYTGLFITAHDAMHGLAAPNKRLNHGLGFVAALLFAYNWYPRLLPRHHLHHDHVTQQADPDYHTGGFWRWYWSFGREYITVWQVLAMAVTYNLLHYAVGLPIPQLLLFWIAPSFLSTLQLFYFGTYRPHRYPEQLGGPHYARSQPANHLAAFFSCYFFGYHYEHHAYPWLPWWKLPLSVGKGQPTRHAD